MSSFRFGAACRASDGGNGWQGLIPQFSRIAVVSVAVIVITGTFASFIQVGRVSALLVTLCGQVLSTKVAFFLLMLPLGAANLIVLARAFARQRGEATATRHLRFFRAVVVAEIILGTVVIALAAFLTLSPPPRGASFASPRISTFEYASLSESAVSSLIADGR